MGKALAFIGMGFMGKALAKGAVAAKAIDKASLAYYTPRENDSELKKLSHLEEVLAYPVIMLAVKPQVLPSVLASLKGKLDKQLIISVAAGITTQQIKNLSACPNIARVMPNTASEIKKGLSLLCFEGCDESQKDFVRKFLKGVGKVLEIDEARFDSATPLSGSGPAYLFYLAEAMLESALEEGFSQDESLLMVKQTLYGAAKLLRKSSESPQELRRQVSSKKGITEVVTKSFDEKEIKKHIKEAIQKGRLKAREMANVAAS